MMKIVSRTNLSLGNAYKNEVRRKKKRWRKISCIHKKVKNKVKSNTIMRKL